jgi:hypothetical protein
MYKILFSGMGAVKVIDLCFGVCAVAALSDPHQHNLGDSLPPKMDADVRRKWKIKFRIFRQENIC